MIEATNAVRGLLQSPSPDLLRDMIDFLIDCLNNSNGVKSVEAQVKIVLIAKALFDMEMDKKDVETENEKLKKKDYQAKRQIASLEQKIGGLETQVKMLQHIWKDIHDPAGTAGGG